MVWSTKWEDKIVDDSFFKNTKNDNGEELVLIGNNFKCANCIPKELDLTDYSNPNLILTFTCDDCGQLFDCKTTKFGVLCDSASAAGWRMKWKDQGYDVYCPQCKLIHQ